MMPETPEHRTVFTARSGDTHVIGDEDNAEAVNLDQAARERVVAEEAKPAARAGRPARPPAPEADKAD